MSSKTLQLTDAVRDYLLRFGVREDALLAELRAETAAMPQAQMQIAPEQGAFMGVLALAIGARRALEVGTFTGYSSTVVARALPPDGRLVCCDVSEEFTSVARRYWARAGVADRIDLRIGPALATLDALRADGQDGTYDLAFVDADKENYPAYVDRVVALLRPRGVLLVDNVLWSGSVADPNDQRETTVALRRVNEALASDPRVDVAMLPLGDGLTMAVKR